MCLVCMRARPLDGCECVCVSTKGSCSLLEVAGIVMNLKVGVRCEGDWPADRCVESARGQVCVLWPGPEPVCMFLSFLRAGLASVCSV